MIAYSILLDIQVDGTKHDPADKVSPISTLDVFNPLSVYNRRIKEEIQSRKGERKAMDAMKKMSNKDPPIEIGNEYALNYDHKFY